MAYGVACVTPERKQRKQHANMSEKLEAVALFKNGVHVKKIAKKHKVTVSTIYTWGKLYGEQNISEVDNYINECVTNPECIHSIELGPEAYEQVIHLCKVEERSIDGEIRYLIKQAYAAQCNRIPF